LVPGGAEVPPNVDLADHFQRIRGSPGFESRPPRSISDEVVLTEDGEIAVARAGIEIHRRVDVVLLRVEAAPATRSRLEYE
jgi:hypothetical protein